MSSVAKVAEKKLAKFLSIEAMDKEMIRVADQVGPIDPYTSGRLRDIIKGMPVNHPMKQMVYAGLRGKYIALYLSNLAQCLNSASTTLFTGAMKGKQPDEGDFQFMLADSDVAEIVLHAASDWLLAEKAIKQPMLIGKAQVPVELPKEPPVIPEKQPSIIEP